MSATTTSPSSGKGAEAFRTISEVADALKLPQHVLRFWETRFTQIKPLKRAGGRRFYRPQDVELLAAIRHLLYGEGYTIKGVQRILREQGPRGLVSLVARPGGGAPTGDMLTDINGAAVAESAFLNQARGTIATLRGVLVELAECRRMLEATADES